MRSWGPAPLGSDRRHTDEISIVAKWAARQRRGRGQRLRCFRRDGGQQCGGGISLRAAMRREDAVVTDFGETARQDMLHEAFEKLDSGEGRSFQPLSTIISIAECDVVVVNGFDATVGDGDAKDITGEIFQNLVARTSMFGMHDPVLFPDRSRNVLE